MLKKEYKPITIEDLNKLNSKDQNELLELIIDYNNGNIYNSTIRFFDLFGIHKSSANYPIVKQRIEEIKKLI